MFWASSMELIFISRNGFLNSGLRVFSAVTTPQVTMQVDEQMANYMLQIDHHLTADSDGSLMTEVNTIHCFVQLNIG